MRKKRFLAVLLCMTVFLSCSISVFAATPTYSNHKMSGGIDNIYVYIDDKGPLKATYWQNLIKVAINNWMYTGVGANKFYVKGYVNSGTSGSRLDFYSKQPYEFGEMSDDFLAATTHWTYSISYVNPHYGDWYSAQIDINDSLLRQDIYTNDAAIGLFVHEIGHGLGLDHSADVYSIMYPSLLDCRVTRVQKVDNDALNSLY